MDETPDPLLPCTEPVFAVCLDVDLPSFMPARTPVVQKRPSLSELLARLMAAAGCNVIEAPALVAHPPSIHDGLGALQRASKRFLAGSDIPLDEVFWTHPLAYRQGAVTRALHTAASRGQQIQGFLAVYAREVRTPLLYNENTPPLRVRDTIEVPSGVDGPFLVLVVFDLAENEDARPIRAYAQPIYQAQRFVPVASNLERDVLKLLEHLQATLESYAIDADVVREIPDCAASQDQSGHSATITLTASDRVGRRMRLTMRVEPEASSTRIANGAFLIDRSSLENGSLVSWLQREIYEVYREGPSRVSLGASTIQGT